MSIGTFRCIDVNLTDFEVGYRFWSAVTGWEVLGPVQGLHGWLGYLGRATPPRTKVLQVQEGRRRSSLGTGQRDRVGLPQVPHRGTDLELARQPLGPAEPPTDVRLTRMAETVKLSSKLFLLSADDTLHALASTAFMRMLRQEDLARVPDFAGQRVRQASVVVQVVDGTPLRMVHSTFSILDIKPDGLLDVDRLNTQQIARLDVRFDRSRPADEVAGGPVIDAAQRFVARGGSWEPDSRLLRRIEAAALGQVSCPRVRLLR